MLDPVDRRTDDQANLDDVFSFPGLYGLRLLVSDDRQSVLGGLWMSELVLEVLLVVLVASTVVGNASLALYVLCLYKQEQRNAELAERLLEGEDDETTD